MQLRTVTLKHFRSIKDCTINIGDVTALVGENNSGKSSLLRALNLFFNYKKEHDDLITDKHQYSPHSRIQIILTFCELPNDAEIQSKASGDGLVLKLQFMGASKSRKLSYKKGRDWKTIDPDFIEYISTHIGFVLIPPTRSKEEISWQEETLLRMCVDAYLGQATSNRDTFTRKFTEAARELENRALNKIAKRAKDFYSLRHDFDYSISYKSNLTYKDFLTSIDFKVREKDKLYDLEDCGTGIQSLTIIALHRLLAEIEGRNVIFGLEEPETNLHPQAQKELIHSIKEAAENNEFSQIICTTHSPVVIDQLLHQQVKLFRKVPESKRGFKTEVSEIDDQFFEVNDITEYKYIRFHQYRNSEFFFSKYVVIVEGEGDAEVIKLLLKKSGYDLDFYGVSFIHLDGVKSLKYPVAIVRELGLPNLIVVDKDFFFPYKNASKANSRNSDGFFQYEYTFKSDPLIRRLLPSARNRSAIQSAFKKNHTKAQDKLDSHGIVCMRYCLEMDLLFPSKGAELAYDICNIPVEKQNKRELLLKRHDQIKKPLVLNHIVENLPDTSLPRSLLRIRKHLLLALRSG
jgi:putative ATP-dependent endonuclease of the OLD family